jgi:hypothetical protein
MAKQLLAILVEATGDLVPVEQRFDGSQHAIDSLAPGHYIFLPIVTVGDVPEWQAPAKEKIKAKPRNRKVKKEVGANVIE